MGNVVKRFGDESDFALASELALSSLADDQEMMHKMVSFLGFKSAVLFFIAFGGQKIKVPTLANFTHNVVLARAAVDVVRKGKNIIETARKYGVKVADINRLSVPLRKNIKVKKEFKRLYSEAASKMFIHATDVANQISEETPSDEPEET